MRRWMTVLLCGVILLAGCSSAVISPVVSGFRCRVDMDYDGQEFSGVLDRTAEGITTLLFEEPSSLDGFCLRWDGTTVAYGYGEFLLELDAESVPVGTAVKVLCDALEACDTDTSLAEDTVTGEAAFGSYTLTFDMSSGYPLALRCDALSLEADFSLWESA